MVNTFLIFVCVFTKNKSSKSVWLNVQLLVKIIDD